jgi:hypothetical protein
MLNVKLVIVFFFVDVLLLVYIGGFITIDLLTRCALVRGDACWVIGREEAIMLFGLAGAL